jgi:glycosyltransferase involved in cell wall biosynthesis
LQIKSQNGLVSLIVPNKNHGEFLEETLKSISDQTYKNIEIILVDSNSTDNSTQIASKFKNLKFYQQEDRSPSHAVAIGLSQASGEFFMFLTSTDLLVDDNFIKQSVEVLNSDQSISLVYGNYAVYKDGIMEIPDKNVWKLEYRSHEKLFLHWLVTSQTFIEMSYIIRKKVALNCVGDLESYDKKFEDSSHDILNVLKLNFMKYGYIAKHFPMTVVCFRIHNGQISASSSSLKIFHNHMKNYFDACNSARDGILKSNRFCFLNSNSEVIRLMRIRKNLILSRRLIYRFKTKLSIVCVEFINNVKK